MRPTLTSPAALLLAALAVPVLAAPAFAQTPANQTPANQTPANPAPASQADTAKPMTRDTAGRRAHRWSPEERARRVEARITRLHDQLGITATQEPQWKVFAGVMRDNAERMAKGFAARGAHFATMSAAANMQSWADMAVQHAQDTQRLAVAFQSVYDSLSPAQKRSADTLFRTRHDRRHHHRGATPGKS